MAEPYRISCAVCGKACVWIEAGPFGGSSSSGSSGQGWYCARCDAFTETDVEVED